MTRRVAFSDSYTFKPTIADRCFWCGRLEGDHSSEGYCPSMSPFPDEARSRGRVKPKLYGDELLEVEEFPKGRVGKQ